MAADIEFNVRNGMTVGANKHMVLDVNGALSAANIVIHTGGKLLSAGEHDIIDVINTSITSSTEMLYIGGLSADWESTHTTVGSYSGDWESTHTSVMTTSTNWDDVYTDVGHNRGNWNSVYTTVGSYSGDWESVHASVLTTSSNWDDVYTDVGHNRGNWNSVYTTVGSYSGDWDSTRTSVFTTSGEWDTAYGWGNHATQNYATTSDVSTAISNLVDSAPATLDTLNELAAALGDDANFSTTITNSIGTKWTQDDDKITNWDSVYLTTEAYSADWDSTRTSVFTNSADWETAHGWGDHAQAGYLTSFTETDPVFSAHVASNITAQQITNWDHTYTDVSTTSGEWDTAYGWGDHGSAGYLTSFTETDPVFSAHAAANITTQQITNWDSVYVTTETYSADWNNTYTDVSTTSGNWNTAHGWGDHAQAGYLTSFTETDPVFSAHAAAGVTTQKITNWDNTYTDVSTTSGNWNTAHGWGDHAQAGYITDYTVTEADVTGHQEALHVTTTVSNNSGDWETAHGWGDHAQAGYITDYTVTEADVTGHQEALHVTTTVFNNSASWADGGTTTLAGATDTDITNPAKGELLVYTNGATQKWINKPDRGSLEAMYNYANTQFYNELSYDVTGKLTGVDVWVTSSKSTKLFERTFTYDVDDNLTTVVTKDVQGGSTRHTLTKTLTYTNGTLTSVSRVYS